MRFLLHAGLAALLASCTMTNGAPEPGSRSSGPADLYNITWQWESTTTPVEQVVAASPERYTIHFAEDGKVRAQFDCNSGRGDFTINANQLEFGPLIATRMACAEDTQDFLFMRDLQRVSSFFIQGGELFLELPYDSGTMRFREAGD